MIIRTEEQLNEAFQFISEQDLLAYDIETDGLNVRKDRIIGIGISNAETGYYLPVWEYSTEEHGLRLTENGKEYANTLLYALQSKRLICHNASFDLRFTKAYFGTDLLSALHADTMLMAHTCDENKFSYGLKEITSGLFGDSVKEEKKEMQASIKVRGGTAKQYFMAEAVLLAKYCISDCLLTYGLYLHYMQDLQRQGLETFFFVDEVMPLYSTVVIPMEQAGVQVDFASLQKANAEITVDLQTLEQGILKAVNPHLAYFWDWFLTKEYPLKTPSGRLTKVGEIHKEYGVTDAKRFAGEQWEVDNPGIYSPFNLLSKHHLKKLFFDTLKETPLSYTKPSKTFANGQPQVDEEFLELMTKKYDWCSKLIEFNKLTKLKSTYIERILQESEDARFYASYKMHGTISGRLSGDMQQLPRPLEEGQASPLVTKYTNLIRSFIIAEPGSVLISADYTSLEPHLFAHESRDPAIRRIFETGLDFYSEIAISTEGLLNVSSDKKANNYLPKIDKIKRQDAKSYSLGIPYGLTGYKLQFELGCTQQEGDALVNKYWAAYPELKKQVDTARAQGRTEGRICNETGRVRRVPDLIKLWNKHGASIEDDLALWKKYHEYPSVYAVAKQDRRVYKKLMNSLFNFRIQGLGASIINRASIALVRKLNSEQLKSRIIGQFHDALLMEVPNNETERVNILLRDCLENTYKVSVPLEAIPITGINLAQCK